MVSSNLFCALLSKHAVFFKLSFHRQGVFINAVTCSWPTILLTCFFNTVKLKKKRSVSLLSALKFVCSSPWKTCVVNYSILYIGKNARAIINCIFRIKCYYLLFLKSRINFQSQLLSQHGQNVLKVKYMTFTATRSTAPASLTKTHVVHSIKKKAVSNHTMFTKLRSNCQIRPCWSFINQESVSAYYSNILCYNISYVCRHVF